MNPVVWKTCLNRFESVSLWFEPQAIDRSIDQKTEFSNLLQLLQTDKEPLVQKEEKWNTWLCIFWMIRY